MVDHHSENAPVRRAKNDCATPSGPTVDNLIRPGACPISTPGATDTRSMLSAPPCRGRRDPARWRVISA